ncbi:MAG: radical SAM protein [Magnetococcales bacterium]|nr:radical SAM protein [Magnetococcales bacterium]
MDFYRSRSVPLDVSYFVNNACDLGCRHCYVGYDTVGRGLSEELWSNVFDDLIGLGALTFGAVGKEPLVGWTKTQVVLRHLRDRRHAVANLRFGLVTNLTRLTPEIGRDLDDLMPDYMDVSIDGNRDVHDALRGKGTYDRTVANLERLSDELRQRVFISFTLGAHNASCLPDLLQMMGRLKFGRLLISPYVGPTFGNDLYLPVAKQVEIAAELVQKSKTPLASCSGVHVYVKSDVTTTPEFARELTRAGLIDIDRLLVDDYGVLVTEHSLPRNNVVFFNYQPCDPSFVNAIRITHDGYVVRCADMFHADAASRAIGHVRQTGIGDILRKTRMDLAA